MRIKATNLLIADDNKEFTAILAAFLGKDPSFKIVGIAHDGEAALKLINQFKPDVIVLDIIMPYLDGIGVLERVRNIFNGYSPKVIMFSAVGQDNYISKAIKLGAGYYFMKPFDMTQLSAKIKELALAKETNSETDNKNESFLRQRSNLIDEVLREFGINERLKGYVYLKDAISFVIEEPSSKRKYTTELYPFIAEKHNTKPENVERSIRNCIDVAFKCNSILEESMLIGKNGEPIKPSNSKFIELALGKYNERRVLEKNEK